jgi:hypothetical protein
VLAGQTAHRVGSDLQRRPGDQVHRPPGGHDDRDDTIVVPARGRRRDVGDPGRRRRRSCGRPSGLPVLRHGLRTRRLAPQTVLPAPTGGIGQVAMARRTPWSREMSTLLKVTGSSVRPGRPAHPVVAVAPREMRRGPRSGSSATTAATLSSGADSSREATEDLQSSSSSRQRGGPGAV